MGGSVFALEGLSTPRMPPETYTTVKHHVHDVLRKSFTYVATPIEAPNKKDHGDIDVLVAEPIDPLAANTIKACDVASLFDTIQFKTTPHTVHLALPWPESNSSTEPTLARATSADEEDIPNTKITDSPIAESKYIQVDIHLCPSPQNLQWHLFLHAHADLWNILGGIIRLYGLTCSDTGFYIRIAEIEQHNRNLARVLMTTSPEQVLSFVGLDEQRYWSAFASWDELMAYAATCRFHDPGRAKRKDVEDVKMVLKHNDRARARKRPMFNYWIEQYMPAHKDEPPRHSARMTREEVIDEAKSFFGEDFANSFEQRRRDGIRTIGLEQLWSGVRKSLGAEGAELTYAMKGLKREIVEDAIGRAANELTDTQNAYLMGNFEEVATWAKSHWQEVGHRQEALDKAKSAMKYREKKEKELAAQEHQAI